jgi:DNA-binding NtrC family response regulator
LHLPPLRERREDVSLLFRHFMKREALKMGLRPKDISREAMLQLINYTWVGNIRELENLVRFLLVVTDGDTIGPPDLPFLLDDTPKPDTGALPAGRRPPESPPWRRHSGFSGFGGMTWAEVEKAYVQYLVEKNGGNITRAAQDAGVKRSTFVSRMRRIGVKRQDIVAQAEK